MDDRELAEIRRAADAERLTVSEWVRQALRKAREGDAAGEAAGKVAAVRAAARHAFPTADIDRMLEEIAAGYDAPAA